MTSKDSFVWYLIKDEYEQHITDKVLDLILYFIKDYAGIEKYDDISGSKSEITSLLSDELDESEF